MKATPTRSVTSDLARRDSGTLLHVSSLPGPWGIGDLGPASHTFVDALARAKQSWWQILPLGPPDAGDSPYQCFSSVAGNPNFVSPDMLIEQGLLNRKEIVAPRFAAQAIEFSRVNAFKEQLLERAYANFRSGGGGRDIRDRFAAFSRTSRSWLDDYAIFMALRQATGTAEWTSWPRDLARRKPDALRRASQELREAINYHKFVQFLFFEQLHALRAHAHANGVRLVGDMPMFVSGRSADVWSNPELFELDRHGRAKAVAGVPPDYFSTTGQRWGNPLFDWNAMANDKFTWWINRLERSLQQVDLLRIDHFRGFAGFWRIPAKLPTAVGGKWMPAPGRALFETLRRKLGSLPFIAEDLGVITPDVEALRDDFVMPGMRVLQFAIGDNLEPGNPFLPHHYVRNAVVYTGTHDNDTTPGWIASLSKKARKNLAQYIPECAGKDLCAATWALMRLAWGSVANHAVAPLQDVLCLGSEARMNVPGKGTGNWRWRFTAGSLRPEHLDRLAEMTIAFDRAR